MADKENTIRKLSDIPGVGDRRAEMLFEAGITSAKDIVDRGLSGLAEIPQLGFTTAKTILDGAREIIYKQEQAEDTVSDTVDELEPDEISEDDVTDEDMLEALTDLEKRLEVSDTEDEISYEEDDDSDYLTDDTDKSVYEDLEDLTDDTDESVYEDLEDLTDDTDESVYEDLSMEFPYGVKDISSELEDILQTMDEIDEFDISPDMETALEIDRWLEEKIGIEGHIGEESICPVCGDIVSIYEERCNTCGVEFAPSDVRCGYCNAVINAELMTCPVCKMSLVDEKTMCPLCDSTVFASERLCPFCHAEFHEDKVRCGDCKTTVPIDAIICPSCDTLLREKILEDVLASRSGPLKVTSESTRVDIDSIQLQVTPAGNRGPGLKRTRGNAKMGRVLFPFSAIVNQERMKRALILNAINPDIGGLLIEGQRGTAKSVAVRGLAEVLPPLDVIKGCRFSCAPNDPDRWCLECRDRYGEGVEIPTETRPVVVVDLPLNATEDRVVGTMDVEKILFEGVKSFEEGILAEVNRGILYVDEINLLDDYIVDVLLDAAAMGVVTVEREEISLSYPSKFIIVGSMNPEEGALRPQLLDRLALNVKVSGISDAKERIEIIHRNEEFARNPHELRERYKYKTEELRTSIVEARKRIGLVTISPSMDNVIARLAVDFEVDGHRADIIMKRAALTNAAYEGRTEVNNEDIMMAAEMALPHRMRKGPLEEAEFSSERLKRLIRSYSV